MAYVKRVKTTTYKKRNNRKRTTNVSTIRRIARQVVLKQAETKRHMISSGPLGLEDVILPDNVSRWVLSNVMDLSQGLRDDQVIGTQIYARGIALKLQFKYSGTFAPYFKLFVVQANSALLGGTNSIFEGTLANAMLDNIKKEYKILKCIIVNPQIRSSLSSGTSHQNPPHFRKLWIPLNQKYDYRTDSLNNGVNKNIAVLCVAYATGNLLDIDVGTVSCHSTLYFKDF